MKIVFASSNLNKAKEIKKILPDTVKLLTLADLDLKEEIPETADTLQGNAILKADYVTKHFGLNCFADDTGLEIEALNHEPGVRSARYAGEQRDNDANMNLVLDKLKEIDDRSARFRTVIALNLDGKQHLFEGIVNGVIRSSKSGDEGFGYDPIFEPESCGRTFAEMSTEEKNQFSHRARATKKMIEFFDSI